MFQRFSLAIPFSGGICSPNGPLLYFLYRTRFSGHKFFLSRPGD